MRKSRNARKSARRPRKSVRKSRNARKSARRPRKSVRKSRKSTRRPRKSVRKSRKSVIRPRKSVRKSSRIFRNKIYGYRMGPDSIKIVMKEVEEVFPESDFKYDVWSDEDTITIDINCDSGIATILIIKNDEIFVNYLSRCESTTGTQVLKNIIKIGKRLKSLGIKKIRLLDASSIQYTNIISKPFCSSSLRGLLILTKEPHESWYNKYGFKSENYEYEIEKNREISNLPLIYLLRALEVYRKNTMSIFMRRKSDKLPIKDWEHLVDDSKVDKIIEEFMSIYEGEIDINDSIKNGVKKMYDMARKETLCSSPKIKMYDEIMKAAFTYLAEYDNKLVYIL
jgi:hypothetical protein